MRLDTFYLVEGDRLIARSEAALAVARHLRWPWRALLVAQLLPRGLRDFVYNKFASKRFRWFGRHDFCAVPESADPSRFLT